MKTRPAPLRWMRSRVVRVLRLKGDPFSLARGVGIGVFVGLTPTIPFHTALTGLFCLLCRGNVLAGIASNVLVSNPVTIPLHYAAAWVVGSLLFPGASSWDQVSGILAEIRHASLLDVPTILGYGLRILGPLLLGGVLIALPPAILAYFLVLRSYIALHRRRSERLYRGVGAGPGSGQAGADA